MKTRKSILTLVIAAGALTDGLALALPPQGSTQGGCSRPFAGNGCGGMDSDRVVL